MKKIKIDYPTTTAEAIRLVCYIHAWRVRKLAHEIGADEAHLSRIINHKETGTNAMTQRVLEHMPASATRG